MAGLSLADWHVWALVIATSLAAGAVRGFTGFGGPAIMVLVLTQFFAPASVLALVLLVDYAANLQLFPAAIRHAAWRSTLPLILASSVAIPFGVHLLQGMDPLWLKRGIALLVGACACVMLANWRYRRDVGMATTLIAGTIGGVIVGATFIALPLMIFFFAGPAPASQSRANAITWGLFTSSIMIVLFFRAGLLGIDEVWRAVLLALFYMLGAHLGARAFRRANEERFRQFVLVLPPRPLHGRRPDLRVRSHPLAVRGRQASPVAAPNAGDARSD